MINYIILGIIAGLPILLLFLLRANAALAFFALCAGIVLLKYIGEDAQLVLTSTLPHSSIILQEALNLSLVLTPMLAAIIRLRKGVSGAKAILNLLPAAMVGLLCVLSVVPLISVVTRNNIMHTHAWSLLEQMQGFVVGSGVLVSVLLLKGKKSEKGRKGHK